MTRKLVRRYERDERRCREHGLGLGQMNGASLALTVRSRSNGAYTASDLRFQVLQIDELVGLPAQIIRNHGRLTHK
jgi:hypothetical protein